MAAAEKVSITFGFAPTWLEACPTVHASAAPSVLRRRHNRRQVRLLLVWWPGTPSARGVGPGAG